MTVKMLEQAGIYEELERKANVILDPVRELIREKNIPACIQQVGSMFTIFFGVTQVSSMEDAKKCDLKAFARFFKYMFANSVYIPPAQYEAWFVSMAHEEKHLEKTRDLIRKFFGND